MHLARLLPLVLLSLPLAAQTTIHVPGDYPTIQQAIVAAQDGDTVLVAPGTYVEQEVDFLGKAITVESEGGAAVTTIGGPGLYDSVVFFHSGEGPDAVLRGFTITGGNSTGRAGGISCYWGGGAGSPLIQSCVIRGNRSSSGLAGGITGNPTIEDCVIEDNWSGYSAGGVWGAPVMRRCTVQRNLGYDGGGIWLHDGGLVEDCMIVDNVAFEGTHGGGVFMGSSTATPVLRRCLIARNTAATRGQYFAHSAAVGLYSGSAPALVENCTIVDNLVSNPYYPTADDCGGIRGPVQLVNTIVRDNDGLQIDAASGATATYSDIQGGLAGAGNFDLDPLFVDAAAGDYHLQVGSPCFDAGDPASPSDPDGTRADVGAYALYRPQADVTVRTGTGVNPLDLLPIGMPELGASWGARVDLNTTGSAALTGIVCRLAALDPGVIVPQGELLISGPLLFRVAQPSSGTFDDFFFQIPHNTALLGFEAHMQGYALTPGVRLSSALLLKLGL